MPHKTTPPKWVANTSGYQKIFISLAFAACCFAGTLMFDLDNITRYIISWDAFSIAMISMSLLLFFKTTAGQLHQIVTRQDDDISVIFAIVLTAVCTSLLAALLLILNTGDADKGVRTLFTILAIATSWVLLHTIFTIRYAHLYHSYHGIENKNDNGGLDFPGDEEPDYIDFAYFSFVIGMTFQVSDVTISGKTIRRYALLHSLISFVFNTIIVALTVNIIAGIIK